MSLETSQPLRQSRYSPNAATNPGVLQSEGCVVAFQEVFWSCSPAAFCYTQWFMSVRLLTTEYSHI